MFYFQPKINVSNVCVGISDLINICPIILCNTIKRVMLTRIWLNVNVGCCLTVAKGLSNMVFYFEIYPDIPRDLRGLLINREVVKRFATFPTFIRHPGTQQYDIIPAFELPTLSVLSG